MVGWLAAHHCLGGMHLELASGASSLLGSTNLLVSKEKNLSIHTHTCRHAHMHVCMHVHRKIISDFSLREQIHSSDPGDLVSFLTLRNLTFRKVKQRPARLDPGSKAWLASSHLFY